MLVLGRKFGTSVRLRDIETGKIITVTVTGKGTELTFIADKSIEILRTELIKDDDKEKAE